MDIRETFNFSKAKEEFFNKEQNLHFSQELILFLSFLKQVGLAPTKEAQRLIAKTIKDDQLLSAKTKKLLYETYVIDEVQSLNLEQKLKIDFKTRYFQRALGDIIIEQVDVNQVEEIFIKKSLPINLEPLLNNLIINFLRNYEKTDDVKASKLKSIIYPLLDKYKNYASENDMDNFLRGLCLKLRSEMKGKEGKRNKVKETLEMIHYLNPSYLEMKAEVFISSSAVVYTKAHLSSLLDTSFSNNKDVLYKLLWAYLSRNINYNSQISLVVNKLKTEIDFFNKLNQYSPLKYKVKKETLIEIEKEILSLSINKDPSISKKRLKI